MIEKKEVILSTLAALGGAALMSEISAETSYSVNSISRILGRTEGWEKVSTRKSGLRRDVLIKLTREFKEAHLFWRLNEQPLISWFDRPQLPLFS